jgi:hypothetical protein
VCDRPLQYVVSPNNRPPALPGELSVCRICKSILYFGPAGWRALEDHELSLLAPAERVCLEILMTAKVDA